MSETAGKIPMGNFSPNFLSCFRNPTANGAETKLWVRGWKMSFPFRNGGRCVGLSDSSPSFCWGVVVLNDTGIL